MGDALLERLKQMQSGMAQQMEDYTPGGNFDPLEDGIYNAKVKPLLLLSKGGKLMVSWTFVIADGQYEGRKIFDNTVLEGNEGPASVNQAGSHICRGRIEALGKDWPERNLQILKSVIDGIDREEPTVEIDLRQKASDGKYTNYTIYIRTSNADAPADDSSTTDDTSTADETPSRPLIDFCTKHDIEGVTDDMDDDTIIASLIASDFKFAEADLDAEEIELLKSFTSGEDLIEVAKPAPKALTKKPAPKPVAKKKKR